MTPRTGIRRRYGRNGEHGQMIVLFALCLVAIIAVAGLLIDGGMAWSNRRQAQAAADTTALAAAKAIVGGASTPLAALQVAKSVALSNGFQTTQDCSGASLPTTSNPVSASDQGVTVNIPPQSGPNQDTNHVEVITTRKMTTTFSGALGMSCWMVSARAVAAIATSGVANCSFCSLNDSWDNHTLVLQNGSQLRVDGDIYVNSRNGLPGGSGMAGDKVSFDGVTCTPGQEDGHAKGPFFVCGDGFDIFGAGGTISAKTIAAVGGWETHNANIAYADSLAKLADGSTCPLHPQPLGYSSPLANVCIGMPVLPDPLNDPAKPGNRIDPPNPGSLMTPAAGEGACPAGALSGGTVSISSGSATICPGLYTGGVSITGSANVTMVSGIYYIAGGGFQVGSASGMGSGMGTAPTANLDGTAGVMIYNSSGLSNLISTPNPGNDLLAAVMPSPARTYTPRFSGTGLGVTATDTTPTTGQAVTYTLTIDKSAAGGAPNIPANGKMSFYDGFNLICPDVDIVSGGGTKWRATCVVGGYANPGTRWITGLYLGDATSGYNPVSASLSITVGAAEAGSINLVSNGSIRLKGLSSGPYAGLTIFQDRSVANTITIDPGASSAPDCPIGFINSATAPSPCGALGGIVGTIYAANAGALVDVEASGVADLQLISGKIQIVSDNKARFAYTPSLFANGKTRLVE